MLSDGYNGERGTMTKKKLDWLAVVGTNKEQGQFNSLIHAQLVVIPFVLRLYNQYLNSLKTGTDFKRSQTTTFTDPITVSTS